MSDEQIIEVIALSLFGVEHGGRLVSEWPPKVPETDRGEYGEDAAMVLAALRDAGYELYRPDECEPRLGCATTRELLMEITSRIDVLGQLDYSTVRGVPGLPSDLVPVGESNER